jgi:anti-sigma factor RsiW
MTDRGHVRDDLTAHLDGALDPGRGAEVEAHLAACPACRAERDRLSAALATLASAPPPPPPPADFERRFQARLARELERRPSFPERLAAVRWRWLAPVAGAAAAAAVAVAVVQVRTDRMEMARHLDLLEDYEAVASLDAVDTEEDLDVVVHLHQLEGRP